MADIFVSYSRTDRDKVAPIVALLQLQGWSVWWDPELRAGEQWTEVIEREIKAARCVLVVWSAVSVTRRWVQVEAHFGLERDNLVPVIIEEVEQPFGFGLVQAANLAGWSGDAAARVAQRVVEDVRARLGTALQKEPAPTQPPHQGDAAEAALTPASSQAAHDWALIAASSEPRDFRDFIAEHPQGLLARRARNRLAELAEAAWAGVKNAQDAAEVQGFLRLHADSAHAEAARAVLASLEAEGARLRAGQERVDSVITKAATAVLGALETAKQQAQERRRAEEERLARERAAVAAGVSSSAVAAFSKPLTAVLPGIAERIAAAQDGHPGAVHQTGLSGVPLGSSGSPPTDRPSQPPLGQTSTVAEPSVQPTEPPTSATRSIRSRVVPPPELSNLPPNVAASLARLAGRTKDNGGSGNN